MPNKTSNRVSHFEIPSDDPKRAVKFYTDVFGWEIKKWEGNSEYWLVMTGPVEEPGGINGGIVKRMGAKSDGHPNAFVCSIEVDTLDDMVKKVESNGGSVAEPKMPVPGMGWLAYLNDTEGNIFGMFQVDQSVK